MNKIINSVLCESFQKCYGPNLKRVDSRILKVPLKDDDVLLDTPKHASQAAQIISTPQTLTLSPDSMGNKTKHRSLNLTYIERSTITKHQYTHSLLHTHTHLHKLRANHYHLY